MISTFTPLSGVTLRMEGDWPMAMIELPIAPPYAWSRTYLAAKHMTEHLPGIHLTPGTKVAPTDVGFDVLASDGGDNIAHAVVTQELQRSLQAGDPVVANGVEGDLLREDQPGMWVVQVKTHAGQEELLVPAVAVSFSWRVGRDMWMKAVRLAAPLVAARGADWLGIASLEPKSADEASRRALSAGDPAAIWGLTEEPELNGKGVILVEELGHDDPGASGSWRVRVERLGDAAPTEHEVPATAVGPLPNWPFLGVSVACLRAFLSAHEGLLAGATTEDVCERVCKPLTESAGDSIAACLVRLGAADTATGTPFAAPPTIFVSHARKYVFQDLVETVAAHVDSMPEDQRDTQYLWLGIAATRTNVSRALRKPGWC